ncbi:MAG: hypothetical protein AAF589_04205 [Planctomycetota bacterium]
MGNLIAESRLAFADPQPPKRRQFLERLNLLPTTPPYGVFAVSYGDAVR